MQKILGITEQEQREYRLLKYLFSVQKRFVIEDVRLYEDRVMNIRTFTRLKEDLRYYEQLISSNNVTKKRASDPLASMYIH